MTKYRLFADYDDNGLRCVADRPYALGQHADTIFDSLESAQDVMDELEEGVGDIVDASVRYEIQEVDQ